MLAVRAAAVRVMAKLSGLPHTVLFNSRTSARQHEQAGYRPRRLRVIPNGFDLELFRPGEHFRESLRAELGLAPDAELVGLVARCHPVKDHASFLEAAARLVAAGSGAHFLLAGQETDGRQVAARVEELGLGGRVHALGERHDVARLTAALDVATCCSLAESFPNSVGEAMACAVPCVVTDVGDAAWMVGASGLVAPVRAPAALATAWRTLLALTPEARRRLGVQARERVKTEFSMNQVAKQYEDLYREVVYGGESGREDRRGVRAGVELV
jgi:glycosyltransferase involved in cell wall biosynthesis